MKAQDIIGAAVALEIPEALIACHLPALERLAVEAAKRARIAHAQEVQTDLLRIEKWRGLALARDGDGRTVEAPHWKTIVKNELVRRAELIRGR